MRSRLARLGAVAVGVAALLGSITPPAHATTVSVAAFVGSATIANGLGYPCMGPGGPTAPDLLLCPWEKFNFHPPNGDLSPGVLTVTLTLPSPMPPNIHIDFHHNKQAINALGATVCQNVVVNILKLAKPTTHVGNCAFTIVPNPLNTVAGNCGLSSGQVVVDFRDALNQVYRLDIHFNALFGFLVLTGHAVKITNPTGQDGLVVGLVLAVPPTPADGTGQSCANLTARTFTIAGVAGAVGV